jgi:predicted outer membrane repeat protein
MSHRTGLALTFCLSLSLVFLTATGALAVIRVPDDYLSIQEAIDAAPPGETILVAPGVYTGPLNRNLDFGGRDLILLSEAGREFTILDCQDQGRGFHFHAGETSATLVRGLTILDGRDSSQGGGILCQGASPTIEECAFVSCSSDDGGAVLCDLGAAPHFINCIIQGSFAAFGGGFFCENSSPIVTRCRFDGNHASACGGGAFCHAGSYPTFDHCTFIGNHSDDGGGMLVYDGLPTVVDCIFANNSAAFGGGFFCELPSPTLERCTFFGNTAAGRGGALFFHQGTSPIIRNCTLYENGASEGGGLFHYAATPLLDHTIISFGTAGSAVGCDGGGMVSAICSDVYGNVGGDWIGCIAGMNGVDGNISEDPLFCDPTVANFALCVTSPCATAPCGLMGAWGAGCETPVELSTWGAIKARFK